MRNFLDAIHNKWRWPLIILLIIILILNSKFNIKLDDYSFKTPQENINQFLVKTEGLGPSTMGEAKSGNALYDENRIPGENLSKMGDAKYLVYIHGGSDYEKLENVTSLENAINHYKQQDGAIPFYSIETKDLIDTTNAVYIAQAPVVLELTRESYEGDYRVLVTNMMSTNKDFSKHYAVVDEKDKIITKKEPTAPQAEETFQDKLSNFFGKGNENKIKEEQQTDTYQTENLPDVKEEQNTTKDEETTLFEKLISNWR